MGSATNTAENYILDSILGSNYAAAAGMPATVYVGLFTAIPNDGGGGTEVSTVGTAYARVAVTNNTANWPAASGGIKSNGATIQFPTATATWGTCQWVGIFETAGGTDLLLWGELSTPVTPGVGDAPYFSAATLAITCD